jgi:hypothetical protein
MSVWRVAPAQEHPEAHLVSWRVFELDNGDRHFCGLETLYREGRVSSRVVSFDPESRQGITRSSRCYELQGPPGDNQDALYVWDRWCTRNAIEEFTDVSDLVYKEFTN